MLITNIKALVGTWSSPFVQGAAMAQVPMIANAFLRIEGGKIVDFGEMNASIVGSDFDASDRFVMPAFCDSHTHLVYAAEREAEWEDRLLGLSYQQIAERGGGILNSVDRLRASSEDDLFQAAQTRCRTIIHHGTGAVEIKSGYGLDLDSELKMLRVIRRLAEKLPLTIRATLLAAHAVPREYQGRQGHYVDFICDTIMPAVAAEGLADFVDVFCDQGFFTLDQTAQILECGAKLGFLGKIHANEMATSGGVELGCAKGCLSVDHLERMNDVAFDALVASNGRTMATVLPAASFFLKIPYAPIREMVNRGVAFALASDFNPGSAPSGNMQLAGTLACMGSGALPSEVFTASTINSAFAMGLKDHGRIAVGAVANVCITHKLSSPWSMYYNFGANSIAHTLLGKADGAKSIGEVTEMLNNQG